MTKAGGGATPDEQTLIGTPLQDALTAAEPPTPIDLSGLSLAPGDKVGHYTLIRVLGEGGFGIVFEAERREPMIQRVALKVLKPGMDSRAVLTRFGHERQTLALLDHPNLARVLDAGATERGLPYFVMELVRGRTIGEYADEKKLTLRERLELMLPVCEAVQHAHMRGIIHRDLKPSNIIIAEHEGHATPKVIDFGIAKALGTEATDATMVTEQGQAIGTPEYMSPEQADGLPDVDTRADVYSLGVVLYELLTGVLPFDSRSLRSGGYLAMRRMIREQVVPRASTRLSALGAQSSMIARNRSVDVQGLVRTLRKELEWIPLMAMNKERERRYTGASELADDIRSYLAGRVLLAGPETFSYRARKFVGRNRLLVGSGSLIALALIAGLAGTGYGLVRAERSALAEHDARTKAEARLRDVRALADSLLFDLNSEIENLPGATGVRKKLIDTALPYLDRMAAEAGDDPAIVADLASGYFRLADLQAGGRAGNLGDSVGAVASHRKAIDLRRKLVERDGQSVQRRADLANSLQSVGHLYRRLNRYPEADKATSEALTLAREVEQAESTRLNRMLLSRALTARAWVLYSMEQTKESEALTRESLMLDETLSADDPTDWLSRSNVAVGYADLGDLCEKAGRTREAADQYAKAVAIYRQVLAANPSNTQNRLSLSSQLRKLGTMNAKLDQIPNSINALKEATQLAEGVHADDPLNANGETSLRQALSSLGDVLESARMSEKAVEVRMRALTVLEAEASTHPDNLSLMEDVSIAVGDVASTMQALERFDEAAKWARRAVEIDREVLQREPNPEHEQYLAVSLLALANVLGDEDRFEDAAATARESLEIRERLLAASPNSAAKRNSVSVALFSLGLFDLWMGRPQTAAELLERAQQFDVQSAGEDPANTDRQRNLFTTREWLAQALSMTGAHTRAAAMIEECVKWRRGRGDSPAAENALADALAFQGIILLHAADAADHPVSSDNARAALTESVQLFKKPEVQLLLSRRTKQRADQAARSLERLNGNEKPPIR